MRGACLFLRPFLFVNHSATISFFLSHPSSPPLCPSEHQNHARELVRKADLSQWDALVIMSGDGLLFEVLRL